jgi:hypothetical protein
MMNRYLLQIVLACLPLAALAGNGGEAMPRPNWTLEAAAAVQDRQAARAELAELYLLARSGRADELQLRVEAIAGGVDRPAPERDYILYELALALAEFDPSPGAAEVLRFLAETPARTLIPHEENAHYGWPLYNIRAAATGALSAWERRSRPGAGTLPDAEGFLSTLPNSASVTASLRAARAEYNPGEIEALVLAAPGLEDPGLAAALLAELAPAVIGRPAVDDLLFGLLSHPDLGGSAALALAGSREKAIRDRLAVEAVAGEGLAARRAAVALANRLAEEENE